MKEKTTDRRVQRTKKALSEAFIQLILEKGYQSVTIQDITEKANVGRSTFYIHYENKEQLLLDGPTNLGVNLFEGIFVTGKINLISFFQHIYENRSLSRSMLGHRHGGIIDVFFRRKIAEAIKKQYSGNFSRTKTDKKRLNIISEACAASVIEILNIWVDEEFSWPPQEMAELSSDIVTRVFLHR